MKSFLLVFAFFFSINVFAQNKITIMCSVIRSTKKPIDYGNLDKILPDSLKQSILINPYKEYGMKNSNSVYLWLLMNDWRINSGFDFDHSLIFTKEIFLDDAALALYKQKLIETGKHL